VTSLSWTPDASGGAAPCVSGVGQSCTAPTAGSTMTLTVANLNAGDNIIVHLGEPTGPRTLAAGYYGASTVLKTGYAGMVDAISPQDLVIKQLALTGGIVTVRFLPPPAQGSNVPVIVERVAAGVSDFSSVNFNVDFAAPAIATFDVLNPAGCAVASRAGVDATTYASVADAVTAGPPAGTHVRVRGANLGVYPDFAIGGAARVPDAAVTDCSASAGGGTCWDVAVPMGQGTGGSATVGGAPLLDTLAESALQKPLMFGLFNAFYSDAAWGLWPGGYFLWLQTSGLAARPIRFAFQAPSVLAVVSLDASGSFPASGGTRASVRGANFGDAAASLATLAVALRDGLGRLTLCTAVARSTALAPGVEGLDFTLPAGSASASFFVVVSVADQTASSATPLLTFNADPAIDRVVVTALNGTVVSSVDFTTAPAGTVVRAPTDGATLSVCGRFFGLAPAVYVALSQAWGTCASPLGACCVSAALGAGEGFGQNWYLSDFAHGSVAAAPGFSVAVRSNGQTGSVPFAYNAPAVLAVASGGPGGTFPTAGGVPLTITGVDFGATAACNTSNIDLLPCPTVAPPLVEVGAVSTPPRAGDFTTCASAVRVSSTSLTCVLPPGAGRLRSVRVTVAGLVSVSPGLISYDMPYLVAPYVTISGPNSSTTGTLLTAAVPSTVPPFAVDGARYTTRNPVFTDKTTGGSVITLYGVNFGIQQPQSCVYMTWAARPYLPSGARLTPDCNARVDWLGEGELPASAILNWTDTMISFTVPPGLGWKEVGLNAGGNLLADEAPGARLAALAPNDPRTIYFRYASPKITAVTPRLVDTDGVTLVTLRGDNFGPPPLVVAPGAAPPAELTLDLAPALQGAFLVLQYNFGCLATPTEVDGSDADAAFTVAGAGARTLLASCACHVVVGTGAPAPLVDALYSAAGVSPQPACAAATASLIVRQTHDTIVFVAPAGIGRNRSLSLFVV